MPWRADAAELISRETQADITADDLEAIEPASWSDYLSIGRAVEDGDVVALLNILTGNQSHRPASVEVLLPQLQELLRGEELEEQDNPYGGSNMAAAQQQPQQPQMGQQQQPQQPPAEPAEPNPVTGVTDMEDLQIGQSMQVDGQEATVVRTMPSRGTVEIRMPNEETNRVVSMSETTTAGAIASAPASVGSLRRRVPQAPVSKPRKHGTSRRRKK